MTLNARQLAAVVKAGLIVTNADGTAKEEEYKIIVNELSSFNVTSEQGQMLIETANGMSVDSMVEILKSLSYDDKKYISGYLVAIIVVDGDVDEDEAKAWQAMCSLCEFPQTTAQDALDYWRKH